MIEPTVGRVVWFRAHQNDKDLGIFSNRSQPMAAIVTHVHGPRMVNLVVFDPNGFPQPRTSVPLQQDDGFTAVLGGSYCEWMPYQIGQAKKHDASPTGIVAADPLAPT